MGRCKRRPTRAGATVEFTYDSLGRVTKKTPKVGGVLDAAHVTEYFYDAYAAGGTYVQNAAGRLAAVRMGYVDLIVQPGVKMDYLEEWYQYTGRGW